MSVVPIRAYRAQLLGLEDGAGRRAQVAAALFPSDDRVPRVLMLDGEPFVLFARQDGMGRLIYAQEKALRLDAGMLIEGAS